MTLSKEKFEHILAYAKQQQKLGVHHCNILPDDMVAIMEMATGKLERRERDKQEPVMYAMAGEGGLDADAVSTCRAVVDGWVDEWNEDGEQKYRNVPLYAAPPESTISNSADIAIDEASQSFVNSPEIPDGYALVPIDPTAEMCKAFDYSNAWKEVDFWEGSFDLASGWRAMLAAAPKLES